MEMEDVCKGLQNIKNEQTSSIVSFLKSSDLVEWLHTALPGKIKDYVSTATHLLYNFLLMYCR